MTEKSLSPSAINSYFRCPRSYYYKYILKLPTPPSIHLYRGSLVHNIIEKLFLRKTASGMEKFVKTELKTNWNPQSEKIELTEKEQMQYYKESEKMLVNFVRRFREKMKMALFDTEKIKNERHAYYLLRPKFREKRINNARLNTNGIIDSIETNYDGTRFIIDYKTSKLFRNSVADDYIRQLRIYALLWKEDTNEPIDYVGVNYLRYGETYYFPVNDQMYKDAEADILYVRDKIKSQDINDYFECGKKWCECQTLKQQSQ